MLRQNKSRAFPSRRLRRRIDGETVGLGLHADVAELRTANQEHHHG
jgi:hypothetical protein